MNYSTFASTVRRLGKRRPAGVSRRQKQRLLKFETLEDRRVMSANPVSAGLEFSPSQVRELLLDTSTLAEFAKAAELSQYTDQELASTNEWIVLAAPGVGSEQITAATGVTIAGETGIVPWSYVVDTSEGSNSQLIDALAGTELVDYFYPLVPFELEALATTNDEFLDKQWALINFGQNTGNPDFSPFFGTVGEDINVAGAWDTVTGNGVVIGIVDTGIFTNPLSVHPDLADNLRADLAIDLVDGDNDPAPSGTLSDGHGTAVAGIAAGVGNNSIGITGVAYEADIAPIRLFSDDLGTGVTDQSIADAFNHRTDAISVYNHSWATPPPVDGQGNVNNPRSIIALGPLATTALRNSVFFGRGGLGSIHVFAAGNSKGISDGGNFSETVNSRYTIGVTSVIETGASTGYAESSAAALVAAPSGSNPLTIIRDAQLGSGIYTTDLLGDDGFNQSPVFGLEIDADFQANTDYSSRFNGTSASAPIVSGVIALMLEANPSLTYRDVQHILVRSARQNLPTSQSWITNRQQLFNDPLAFDSDPTDTIFDGAWSVPRPAQPAGGTEEEPIPATPHTQTYYLEATKPHQFTNGAGLTVSQSAGRSDDGFAHGVVDATLAVELARNWVTLGGQTSEFTWTTGTIVGGQVNAAAVSNEESGEYLIPGGVVGDGDPDQPNAFIDFFNEFTVEDDPAVPDPLGDPPEDPDGPFSDANPPVNTRGGPIFLAPPAMTVEWVEVELNLTASDANDFDFLRIILVSPDGTQSELKNYHRNDVEHGVFHDAPIGVIDDPVGNLTNDNATLNAVFTTNRHWGERTESKITLNTDGSTVNFFDGSKTVDSHPNPNGFPHVDGWQLVFENYNTSAINIGTYEVAFHGINAASTGRIQGLVGVDDNADGVFSDSTGTASNFTRYTETNLLDQFLGLDPDDPSDDLTPLDPQYASIASLDPYIVRTSLGADQESWAAGAIVYVDLNSNGERDFTDPHYQLGADGNYYFDLPVNPDGEVYDIRIDPSSLDAAGLLNQANLDAVNAGPFAQVVITAVGERVTGFAVQGGTVSATDFQGNTLTESSVSNLNLLLTPNAQPTNIVNLSGVVYADLNANGVNDGDDAPIGGADVFIDVNQNGVFTPGFDFFTTTDASGAYSFVDQTIVPGFYSVVVLAGTTGSFNSPVTPDDAERAFFFAPELVRDDLDFGFEIDPTASGGNGGSVAISGVVFEDANNNGARGTFETGLAGIATVYLDLDGSNTRDAIEPFSVAGENGSFIFNSLLPGLYTARIEFDEVQYEQTTPAGLPDTNGIFDPDDFELHINVASGTISGGNDFGLHNQAVADFGDLPSDYATASHIKFGDLYLGSSVDAELVPSASADASGDDTLGVDDEDGVVFSELKDDSTSITVTVTANTNGGFLQAWFDFNEDHIFQASEQVILETLLSQGDTDFVIPVPAGLTDGTVFARFRYGEQGISGFSGQALKGEVEDYAIPVVSTAIDPGVTVIPSGDPDFDGDGDVDGSDFLSWQLGFGTSDPSPADGDANGDNNVDATDLQVWESAYGNESGSTAALTSGGGDDTLAATTPATLAVTQSLPSSTELLADYSTPQGSSSTAAGFFSSALSRRVTQPYFGEGTVADVLVAGVSVAGVTDTEVVSQAAGRQSSGRGFLASIASETERLAAHSQRGATPFARLETRRYDETPEDRVTTQIDLRDRIWDQLSSKRQKALEDLLPERLEESGADEALAEAFGEDIDWRL